MEISSVGVSQELGYLFAQSFRLNVLGMSASGPNFLQDRREAVTGASNFGSDLGGSPCVVVGKITSLCAPAGRINTKGELIEHLRGDRQDFFRPFDCPATDE